MQTGRSKDTKKGTGDRMSRPGKLAGKEDQVKAMLAAGESTGWIAKRFNVTPSAISLMARKNGWRKGTKVSSTPKVSREVKIRRIPRGVSGRPE